MSNSRRESLTNAQENMFERIDGLLFEYSADQLKRMTHFPICSGQGRPVIGRTSGKTVIEASGLVIIGRTNGSRYAHLVPHGFLFGRPISDFHGDFGDPEGIENQTMNALQAELSVDGRAVLAGRTDKTNEWHDLAATQRSAEILIRVCTDVIAERDSKVAAGQMVVGSLIEPVASQ